MDDGQRYDVVIIGGGAAGLSGALTLSRARRRVLVVDSGQPRNAPAAGVHGFLTRDGLPPAELVAIGRAEVEGYGGEIVADTVTGVSRDDAGFAVTLAGGATPHGRRLLVATGIADLLPDVEGLRERWGRDVVHCPYCHGWEVRDEPIGVLANGPLAVHQALLFSQWSADVRFFTHEDDDPTDEQRAQLAARGVEVVSGPVAAVEVTADRISGVRLRDGRVVPRRVLAVGARFEPRTEALAGLGLTPVHHVSGMGRTIPADPTGQTAVAGVYVAGNVTDPGMQVQAAAADGTRAAAAINLDLILATI